MTSKSLILKVFLTLAGIGFAAIGVGQTVDSSKIIVTCDDHWEGLQVIELSPQDIEVHFTGEGWASAFPRPMWATMQGSASEGAFSVRVGNGDVILKFEDTDSSQSNVVHYQVTYQFPRQKERMGNMVCYGGPF